MSFIMNVGGDIYAVDNRGSMYFTTLHTPDTIIDIIQLNSKKKDYYFKFRLSGQYAYATARREIFATTDRNFKGTVWKIDEDTKAASAGRISDEWGFKYEAIIQNISISEVIASKDDKPAQVEAPVLKEDEKQKIVPDFVVPSNYNLRPSDHKWDVAANTEISGPRADPNHERPEEVHINTALMKLNKTENNVILYDNPGLDLETAKKMGLAKSDDNSILLLVAAVGIIFLTVLMKK